MTFIQLPAMAYDPMSMTVLQTHVRLAVHGGFVLVLDREFEGGRRLSEIDFTQELVEIGQVRLSSDLLRWSLEDAGL